MQLRLKFNYNKSLILYSKGAKMTQQTRQKIKQILLKAHLGFIITLKRKICEYLDKNNLKIPHPPTLRVGVEDTEENLRKRQYVKDILYTEYNANDDKTLHNFFINNKSNAIHKWYWYFDVYERHFRRFRGKDVNILEIGVQNGGSTKMWKHYFEYQNANVNIYGVDINPKCKEIECDNIKIFIGSQEDRGFWQRIKGQIPKIDILIDDGGHTMRQQIVTFEEMFSHIKHNGIYWCEDLHTSYWAGWGGVTRVKNLL